VPAYSFQKQFVPFVESGEKTHTIRGKRKNRPKPGQVFYGYYAMRTKQCRKIIHSTITSVQDITIELVRGPIHVRNVHRITVDGEVLAADEMNQLAVRDGFTDLRHMMQFWDGRLPFEGHIIHWRKP
jgi:uncharacterized protein YqfB (UPF0267 family)